jgi:hypothetical protein
MAAFDPTGVEIARSQPTNAPPAKTVFGRLRMPPAVIARAP